MTNKPVAFIVCVEYDDLLAITLPHNRQHFHHVVIVTTPEDKRTQEVCVANDATCLTTRVFYERGATFNKGAALERAFEFYGIKRRIEDRWVVVLDADILIPQGITSFTEGWHPDALYTPRRKIIGNAFIREFIKCRMVPYSRFVVSEPIEEHAGYFQAFHSACCFLAARRTWYPTNWTSCGGCDSEFARYWPKGCQHRPAFEVIHLGDDEKNWCGRVTTRLDGTTPPDAAARREKLAAMLAAREQEGRRGRERFRDELLGG